MKRSQFRDNEEVNHPEYFILRFNKYIPGICFAPGIVPDAEHTEALL